MKKIVNWLIAATLIVSGTSVLNSCSKANADSSSAPKVESTELIRTNKSWDGVDLPEYLKGYPELVAVKYVFPVGQKL